MHFILRIMAHSKQISMLIAESPRKRRARESEHNLPYCAASKTFMSLVIFRLLFCIVLHIVNKVLIKCVRVRCVRVCVFDIQIPLHTMLCSYIERCLGAVSAKADIFIHINIQYTHVRAWSTTGVYLVFASLACYCCMPLPFPLSFRLALLAFCKNFCYMYDVWYVCTYATFPTL